MSSSFSDRLRLLAAALVALAALLLPAPAALAAPGWLTPANLSEAGQNASSPQVAMDASGEAVAVWARSNGTNTIVQAAGKPTFGESWSTPENLSAAGQNATVPQVAIDPNGDAVAVWLRSDGANTIVQAASRPAGGSWSGPEILSAAGQNAALPQVGIDAAGDAVAVWSRSNGTNTIVQAVSRSAGGSWSSPVDLSEAGQSASGPQVAVDHGGDAVAVWERSNGTNTIVQAASMPAGGAWSAPANLSEPGANANSPQVALDPAGDAVAVWNRVSGASTIIQAASRPAGGAWSTPTDVSEAAPSTGAARVALDASGGAVAVWRRSNGANTVIQAASRSAGGSWTIPVNLSEAGVNANQPRVAIDPGGDAVAVWTRAGSLSTQAAGMPAGGSWSTPVNLSEAGAGASGAQIAVDSAGDAVSVWQRSNGTSVIAQATGFATGPHLLSSSIPASGTVGEALPFSATWWDAWSPLSAIEWSLGDGASAAGGAVGHAYASPGTYSVGVTATDLRGESSTTGGEVTIAAAPVVPAAPNPGQTGSGQTGSGQAQPGSGSSGAGSGQGGGDSQPGAATPQPGGKPKPKKQPNRHQGEPRLLVSITPTSASARPSAVVGYRIVVANVGAAVAHRVAVCVELAAEQRALRTTPAAAGGSEPCWHLRTLAAGASRVLRLTAMVAPDSASGVQRSRVSADAANVDGVRRHIAAVRVAPLPETGCGSRLARPGIFPRC